MTKENFYMDQDVKFILILLTILGLISTAALYISHVFTVALTRAFSVVGLG